jgi:DNA-directed RNA polymerase subunit RPC12/RpoP
VKDIAKEKIKCPKCGHRRLEKIVAKVGVGSSSGKLPTPSEEYVMYKCHACGHEFEDND